MIIFIFQFALSSSELEIRCLSTVATLAACSESPQPNQKVTCPLKLFVQASLGPNSWPEQLLSRDSINKLWQPRRVRYQQLAIRPTNCGEQKHDVARDRALNDRC